MADAHLGQKRACPSCGGKFYDLTKNPAQCPYCGAVFNTDDLIRGRGHKGGVQEKPQLPEPAAEENEAEDDVKIPDGLAEVDEDEDNEDDVLEDASSIGEDNSDIDVVMEHMEKPE